MCRSIMSCICCGQFSDDMHPFALALQSSVYIKLFFNSFLFCHPQKVCSHGKNKIKRFSACQTVGSAEVQQNPVFKYIPQFNLFSRLCGATALRPDRLCPDVCIFNTFHLETGVDAWCLCPGMKFIWLLSGSDHYYSVLVFEWKRMFIWY